jgi:hypothetical protein
MRLPKSDTERATAELVAPVKQYPGARTSGLQGTKRFPGARTQSLAQITRLLRRAGMRPRGRGRRPDPFTWQPTRA